MVSLPIVTRLESELLWGWRKSSSLLRSRWRKPILYSVETERHNTLSKGIWTRSHGRAYWHSGREGGTVVERGGRREGGEWSPFGLVAPITVASLPRCDYDLSLEATIKPGTITLLVAPLCLVRDVAWKSPTLWFIDVFGDVETIGEFSIFSFSSDQTRFLIFFNPFLSILFRRSTEPQNLRKRDTRK